MRLEPAAFNTTETARMSPWPTDAQALECPDGVLRSREYAGAVSQAGATFAARQGGRGLRLCSSGMRRSEDEF